MTRTANRREHRKCSHVAGEKYSSSFQNVRLRRFARFVVDVRHALEPRLLQRNHFHLWIFFSRFFQDLLGDFSRGHRWSGPERRRGRFRVRVASFKSTFATTAAAALRGADDFRPSFFGRRRSRRCYPFLVRRRRRRSEREEEEEVTPLTIVEQEHGDEDDDIAARRKEKQTEDIIARTFEASLK